MEKEGGWYRKGVKEVGRERARRGRVGEEGEVCMGGMDGERGGDGAGKRG